MGSARTVDIQFEDHLDWCLRRRDQKGWHQNTQADRQVSENSGREKLNNSSFDCYLVGYGWIGPGFVNAFALGNLVFVS